MTIPALQKIEKSMKFLFVFVCFIPSFANAYEDFVSNPFWLNECSKYDTQALINDCSQNLFDKKTLELRQSYEKLISKNQHKKTKLILITEQNRWKKDTETECEDVAFEYRNGSIYPEVYQGCEVFEFNERINSLNNRYSCDQDYCP